MQSFVRGQRIKLPDLTSSATIRVRLDFTVRSFMRVDYSCFALDANGKQTNDRFLVTGANPVAPGDAIQWKEREKNDVDFLISLADIPHEFQRLVFTVTLERDEAMSNLLEGVARVYDEARELVCFPMTGTDFLNEKAIIALEIYRKECWRIGAVGQGFDGGLSALKRHFGSGS